jgi:hypothetical protein
MTVAYLSSPRLLTHFLSLFRTRFEAPLSASPMAAHHSREVSPNWAFGIETISGKMLNISTLLPMRQFLLKLKKGRRKHTAIGISCLRI